MYRIIFILLPVPMSSLLNGDSICKVINFISGMYVAGSYTWGCSIAFFRVIFITAQGFLKGRVEERSLLNVLLLCGLTLVLYYSVTSLLFDDEVPTYKMCTHQSHEDRKIIRFYQVKISPRPRSAIFLSYCKLGWSRVPGTAN